VLTQDRDEIGVCIALVKKNRLADLHGELQLAMEGRLLDGAGRQIAVVVESAFAYRYHLPQRCELTQVRQQSIAELARMMRMNTRCGEQPSGVALRKFYGLARARTGAAGYYHLDHAGLLRACNHGVTIAIEAVVGKIDTDIDQGTGYHV
jgi:hypothetical protein